MLRIFLTKMLVTMTCSFGNKLELNNKETRWTCCSKSPYIGLAKWQNLSTKFWTKLRSFWLTKIEPNYYYYYYNYHNYYYSIIMWLILRISLSVELTFPLSPVSYSLHTRMDWFVAEVSADWPVILACSLLEFTVEHNAAACLLFY